MIQSCIEEILDDFKGNKKRKQKIRYIGPAVLRRAFQDLSENDKEKCLDKIRQILFGEIQEEIGDGFVSINK